MPHSGSPTAGHALHFAAKDAGKHGETRRDGEGYEESFQAFKKVISDSFALNIPAKTSRSAQDSVILESISQRFPKLVGVTSALLRWPLPINFCSQDLLSQL